MNECRFNQYFQGHCELSIMYDPESWNFVERMSGTVFENDNVKVNL